MGLKTFLSVWPQVSLPYAHKLDTLERSFASPVFDLVHDGQSPLMDMERPSLPKETRSIAFAAWAISNKSKQI